MLAILDIRKNWNKGTITYKEDGKKISADVAFIPGTNDRVAMDREGHFYVHNARGDRWSKVRYGIFELERMLWEMLLSYEREVPELHEVYTACEELHIEFEGLTRESSSAERRRLRGKVRRTADALKGSKDADKQRAGKLIRLCIPLRDKEGRINMGVLRAYTAAAMPKLLDRLGKTGKIEPHISYWLGAVRPVVRSITYLAKEIERKLEHTLAALRDGEIKRAERLIDSALRDLAQCTVRPLLRSRKFIRPELERAKENIKLQHFDDVRAEVTRSLNAVRLKRIRIRLESLLFQFVTIWKAGGKTFPLVPILIGIREDMEKIDENGFRQPVVSEAKKVLAEAHETWVRGSIQDAKKLLQKATRML